MGKQDDNVIPPEDFATAIAECRKDPQMDALFSNASQGARLFIGLMFYSTVFGEKVDRCQYDECLHDIESSLTAADFDYLLQSEIDVDTKAYLKNIMAQRGLLCASSSASQSVRNALYVRRQPVETASRSSPHLSEFQQMVKDEARRRRVEKLIGAFRSFGLLVMLAVIVGGYGYCQGWDFGGVVRNLINLLHDVDVQDTEDCVQPRPLAADVDDSVLFVNKKHSEYPQNARCSRALRNIDGETALIGSTSKYSVEQGIVTRMKEMILPAITFKPPATIIDAVDFFRQASKDYDRPDIPIEHRGFNFVLVGISGNTDGVDGNTLPDIPKLPNISVSNLSLWEALKVVCEVVGFDFDVDGSVVKVMPKHRALGEDSSKLGKRRPLKTRDAKEPNGNVVKANTPDAIRMSLFDRVKSCLAIVKAGNCSGSGFLVKMDGKTRFITNEHVARGGNPFAVKTLDGKLLKFEPIIEVAADRDLVRMIVKGECDALDLATYTPKKSQAIHVYGNSDGQSVATFLDGRLNGIGPNLVELECDFVGGNSGSAILDDQGRVLAVATYAQKLNEPNDWTKKGTRFNAVRRFGVRLNDVTWEKFSWQMYSGYSEFMKSCAESVDFFIEVCRNKNLLRKFDFDKRIRSGMYKNTRMKDLILSVVKRDEALAENMKQIERLTYEYNHVHVVQRIRTDTIESRDILGDKHRDKIRRVVTTGSGSMAETQTAAKLVREHKRRPRLIQECVKARRVALSTCLSLVKDRLRKTDIPTWLKGRSDVFVGVHYNDTLVDFQEFLQITADMFDDIFHNELFGTKEVRLPEELQGRM